MAKLEWIVEESLGGDVLVLHGLPLGLRLGVGYEDERWIWAVAGGGLTARPRPAPSRTAAAQEGVGEVLRLLRQGLAEGVRRIEWHGPHTAGQVVYAALQAGLQQMVAPLRAAIDELEALPLPEEV